jgi:hypothetical protein
MVPTLRVVTPSRPLRVHAVCQANRFRHRRNLRQLPQGQGVSFKARDVSES